MRTGLNFRIEEHRMSGKKKSFDADQCKVIDRFLVETGRHRDLAFFRLAVSSMGLCSELLALRVGDVLNKNGVVGHRFFTGQKKAVKTAHLISTSARTAIHKLIVIEALSPCSYLFGARGDYSKPISRRRLTTIVKDWATKLDLDPADYGLHSLRRAGASHIYRLTGNLDATRQLLGHKRVDETIAYLDIPREDVLDWAEKYAVI